LKNIRLLSHYLVLGFFFLIDLLENFFNLFNEDFFLRINFFNLPFEAFFLGVDLVNLLLLRVNLLDNLDLYFLLDTCFFLHEVRKVPRYTCFPRYLIVDVVLVNDCYLWSVK